MPRLPPVRPDECIRALERLGFTVDRQSGSHVVPKKRGASGGRTATVPRHARPSKPGTLHGILRQAGISAAEFLAAL